MREAWLRRRTPCVRIQGYSKYGQPFTVYGRVSPYAFNVSHRGMHGLIAFPATGVTGVDVEGRRSRVDLDRIAETVFGRNGQAAVASPSGTDKVDPFGPDDSNWPPAVVKRLREAGLLDGAAGTAEDDQVI